MLDRRDTRPNTDGIADDHNLRQQASNCMPLLSLCKLGSSLSKAKQADLPLFDSREEGYLRVPAGATRNYACFAPFSAGL